MLDNAPTYLAFLADALGRSGLDVENEADVALFLASGAHLLVAISMVSGSVPVLLLVSYLFF